MKCSQIVLSGGYSGYNALYDFIHSFAESEGYSNVFMHDLQLSLKEAFVNAVKHGNREQGDLTVCCTFVVEPNSLRVSIRDCGKGFDPEDLPNPVRPGYLLKPSGRGVYIIRNIAEIIGLEHNSDGSSLMLRYIPY
jgi:serine/threonine-protein kinase RsbW